MAAETVAAAFAKGLIDYAVSRGVARAPLLAVAGLSPGDLATAEQRVPLERYVLLMRAAKSLSADPAFALHFGESVDIREMSVVALLGQSLGTAMDVFEAVNRYARLDADVATDGPARFVLVPRSGGLWLVDKRMNPNAFPELTESAFARMVSAGRRVGMDAVLRQVEVSHAEPPYRSEYDRIFGVPVSFGCGWNALRLDPGAMAQRIALQPALAGAILSDRADALLGDLDAVRSARGAVEAALRPLLPARKAGIAAVAREIGTSRQTLYRRLKAEQTTFEQVLAGLRLRLARDYLADGTLPVAEIAYRLGFADAASFSKAFKRWTGSSPGAARPEPGA